MFPRIRGTPKWMVYNGKCYSNGWFGGTTIFGNTHLGKKVWMDRTDFVPFPPLTKSKFKRNQFFWQNNFFDRIWPCKRTPQVCCFLLVGGFRCFFFDIHPENWGRWTHFDSCFSNGLVQPPPRLFLEELGTCFVCLIFLSQEPQSDEGEIESGSSQER